MSNMIQKTGDTDNTEATLEGAERIYSQPDTRKMVRMATEATSKEDFIELGRFVHGATRKQDQTPPQMKVE